MAVLAYLWIGDAPDGILCWYEMDAGGWDDAVSARWPTWTERIAASISFRRGHHYKPLIFNKIKAQREMKNKRKKNEARPNRSNFFENVLRPDENLIDFFLCLFLYIWIIFFCFRNSFFPFPFFLDSISDWIRYNSVVLS